MGMTLLDMFVKPDVLEKSWAYYKNDQTKNMAYKSFMNEDDKPAIELNREIMAEFREEMKKYYYDPSKYRTYLEQLGITYPTVKPEQPVP